jgi:hypothetical protein
MASRFDVKNSLTEKCENCTTWLPALSTTATRLEHAEITASSAFSGSQPFVKCGEFCLVETNCKYLCKLFDAKRANRHHETSEQSLCVFSFILGDAQQCPAICFVQCLRQVFQHTSNTWRKCVTQSINLANNPPKPTSCEHTSYNLRRETRYELTYMPSASSDSVSMTSCLSSSFHLRMFGSERTTNLMNLIMSSFCPISS